MPPLEYSLPVIWALVLGVAVALYVVLDGFDLGLGILFPLFPSERERDVMMNSVAPYWDGNETWLVLGGAGLFVAFPKAYAIIAPALYLPLIVLLLALIFRGVAFEFRWVAKPQHRIWDLSFAAGSTLAAFAQGVLLGGLLQGIRVADGRYAGGSFDWLTPFSVVTGLGVVAGYALIGAGWLVLKTSDKLQARARRLGRPLVLALAVFIVAVSIWTPLQFERIAARWFDWPAIAYLTPLPLATAALLWVAWHALGQPGRDAVPFLCAVGAFLCAYLGLVVSNAPYLVPPVLDIWQAAAVPASQIFLLLGTLVLLPLVLGYTAFLYWIFRGKVGATGYH